jgi:hypothetical protein
MVELYQCVGKTGCITAEKAEAFIATDVRISCLTTYFKFALNFVLLQRE